LWHLIRVGDHSHSGFVGTDEKSVQNILIVSSDLACPRELKIQAIEHDVLITHDGSHFKRILQVSDQ
jgi:hypothetical protein